MPRGTQSIAKPLFKASTQEVKVIAAFTTLVESGVWCPKLDYINRLLGLSGRYGRTLEEENCELNYGILKSVFCVVTGNWKCL